MDFYVPTSGRVFEYSEGDLVVLLLMDKLCLFLSMKQKIQSKKKVFLFVSLTSWWWFGCVSIKIPECLVWIIDQREFQDD